MVYEVHNVASRASPLASGAPGFSSRLQLLHSTASVAPVQLYFKDVCTTVVDTSSSAHRGDMFVQRTTTQLDQRSFCVAAPTVWNTLPLHLRSPSISRGRLRADLKTHIFNQAYISLWERFILRVNLLTYLLLFNPLDWIAWCALMCP